MIGDGSELTPAQLQQLNLWVFAQCGGMRLFVEAGRPGFVAAYKDRALGNVIGFGLDPVRAVADCYKRVLEAAEQEANGLNREFRDSQHRKL